MKGKSGKMKNLGRPCEFIEKLLVMMKNHGEHVMWEEGGELLRFTKLEEFQTVILPIYFRHSNILSFMRQLNMYYFSKCDAPNSSEMLFQHEIFRKGNQNNFHKITRRNRFRDEVLTSMRNNFSQTFQLIEKNHHENALKDLLVNAIEYQQILSKSTLKIKLCLEELTEKLKNTRCKESKEIKEQIEKNNLPVLMNHMQTLKFLETFIKNKLCQDSPPKSFTLNHSQSIFNDQLKTFNALALSSRMKSKDNLIGFTPFSSHFKDQEEDENSQAVSLEEDLKNSPFNNQQ